MKTAHETRIAFHERTVATPEAVDAFPSLNLSQTGNVCPMMAINPHNTRW